MAALLGRYRAAAREVSTEAATAQRHIDTIRKCVSGAGWLVWAWGVGTGVGVGGRRGHGVVKGMGTGKQS